MSLTLSTSISNSLLRRLPALAQTLRQDLPLAASFGTARKP